MGFADEVAACSPEQRGPNCTIAIIQATMDPTDAAEFEAALQTRAIPDSQVREALNRRGIDVTINTLGRHRRRQCKCPPVEAQAA